MPAQPSDFLKEGPLPAIIPVPSALGHLPVVENIIPYVKRELSSQRGGGLQTGGVFLYPCPSAKDT